MDGLFWVMIKAGLRDTIGHPGHPRKAVGGLGSGRRESEREAGSKGQERAWDGAWRSSHRRKDVCLLEGQGQWPETE